jgi:aryl carrier-like protein
VHQLRRGDATRIKLGTPGRATGEVRWPFAPREREGVATPRQEILYELFAQVLRVARCGTGSDFFDLGGRSVEAMLLAGRINAGLDVRITMADLFKAPTVADLDRRLDQMAGTLK